MPPDPAVLRRRAQRLDTVRDTAYSVVGIGVVLGIAYVMSVGLAGMDPTTELITATALYSTLLGGLAAALLHFVLVGPLVLLAARLLGLPVSTAVERGPMRLAAVVPSPDAPLLRLRMAALTLVGPLIGVAVTVLGVRLMAAERDDVRQSVLLSVVVAGMLLTAASAFPYRLSIGTWSEGWELGRWLFRPGRARAGLATAHRRLGVIGELGDAVRDLGRLGADPIGLAVQSAPFAAAAWDDENSPGSASAIAAALAGNEAETLFFGLDRPAACCRPDGSVPIAPPGRLAAAAALAEHAVALAPDDAFPAAALAMVRLAQRRPAEATDLLRPHLGAGHAGWRAELLALLALSRADADPAEAAGIARSAWNLLGEEYGTSAHAVLVRHTLQHLGERAPNLT